MLPRKQVSEQEAWLKALETVAGEVSLEEVEGLADQTAAEIGRMTAGKRAAFAWSGGKDSLVLAEVCRRAGIGDCVLVVSNLEYPAFSRWVEEHKPAGLEIVNTGQDLNWLAQNQDMLFPRKAAVAAKWFRVVQHTGQAAYFRRRRLDLLLLGRRRADGNFVGRGGRNVYTNRAGVTRYSPLADWPHEAVLAFIRHHGLNLAPNYFWPRGFRVGTGPWPARQWTRSIDHGWQEVFEIDAGVVREAARLIPSAARFLKRAGQDAGGRS